MLKRELQSRLQARGWRVEWGQLCADLDELQELTLTISDKTFLVRTPPIGEAGCALQAAGVALGPSVRML